MAITIIMLLGLAANSSAPPNTDRVVGKQALPAVSPTTDPEIGDAPPTAEEVLAALREAKPLNRVIAPAANTDRRRALFPEGTALVDAEGVVEREGDSWVFVYAVEDRVQRIRLLPSGTLEQLARSKSGSRAPLRFVVAGEMTVFMGENYLLARYATRAQPPPLTPTAKVEKLPTNASAEDVIKRMAEREPDRALVSPARGSRLLIRRPGRVALESGRQWTFTLEAEDSERPRKKLHLLPSRGLALMVETAGREATGLVFTVSGEIFTFDGNDYLLPRLVIRRFDTGNLRK